jgi:hypothetical protein
VRGSNVNPNSSMLERAATSQLTQSEAKKLGQLKTQRAVLQQQANEASRVKYPDQKYRQPGQKIPDAKKIQQFNK